ncbi:hypothetical protein OUZ56_026672 [Daphnia magna]|uniref:Uncharacterized protein n=1 Tax=Daphnia magna TaxID=35525 RepID=A0ABQ9ZMF2_9CRUS|nr:hypothetical protein OUZ56_026672 [Daphnia magna]
MAAKRRRAVAGCQVIRHFDDADIVKGRTIGRTFFPFQRWNLKSDAKPKHLLNLDQPVPTRGLKSFRQPFQERPNDNHKGKTLVHRNNVKQRLQTKTFYQCGPRALKKEVGHAGGSSWSCLSLQRKDKETSEDLIFTAHSSVKLIISRFVVTKKFVLLAYQYSRQCGNILSDTASFPIL